MGFGRLGLDAGTMTWGINVGAGAGGGCCCCWLFLPVNILTVFCIKSVFCPPPLLLPADVVAPQPSIVAPMLPLLLELAPTMLALSGLLEDEADEDVELQRTADSRDHSLQLPPEPDLYEGGDSDSRTVRFGGGRMHF